MKKIYNLLLFTVLAAGLAACSSDEEKTAVSYTHLTLPTIYSV